jgi:TRAP-type C4-dicarboxylate transport system permease small subunit
VTGAPFYLGKGEFMYGVLSRLAEVIARAMAIIGGIVLLAVIVLTCVSIIGRAFYSSGICCGPIRGIYDYTELGMAVALFAFLPWCQLRNTHASVDLFKPAFPDAMNRGLTVLVDIGMLGLAVLLAQRLYLGMLDKINFGDTTFIAQVPVWWGYAASLVGAVGFVLIAAFCVLRSLRLFIGIPTDSEDYA